MSDELLAPGWDAADALLDGWTVERVAALAKRPGFFLKTAAPPAQKQAGPEAELPRGFEIEESGLYFRDTDEDGKTRRYWICSPLRVIAETRDESGNNWGRLIEFKNNDGQVQRWAMPMELLRADGADYRGTLLSMGLLIGPGQVSKAKLTVYLQIA